MTNRLLSKAQFAAATTQPSRNCSWCGFPGAKRVLIENMGESLCPECQSLAKSAGITNIRLP